MEEHISSRKNPLLQQVKKLLSSRSERRKQGLFVADGTKLLEEAVKYWPGLQTVILTDGVEAQVPDHVRVVRVPEEVMASISPMEAPQGALFLGKLPEQERFAPKKGMLILDGVQDPGNVGTILRTADAMDVPVVLLDGCADPWSWKVIRSTMGAVFRTPVVQASWEEVLTACREANIPIGVTALSDRAVDIRSADLSNMALVIGSEGRGVRKEVLENADHELIIPMNPHCESLNAAIAASIVMWEIRRNWAGILGPLSEGAVSEADWGSVATIGGHPLRPGFAGPPPPQGEASVLLKKEGEEYADPLDLVRHPDGYGR